MLAGQARGDAAEPSPQEGKREKMFFLGLVFGLAGGALLVANSCKARALVKKSQTELLEKVDAMMDERLNAQQAPAKKA